jgi:pyruvate, water dikinase
VHVRVKEVFASLFNDRAIAYRVHHGFDHEEVALSAGIQRMVRSDIGASRRAVHLDTESGFRDVVFITSSYGLGEMVVQGAVNPDEFYVYKPTLEAEEAADSAPHDGHQGHQDGLQRHRHHGKSVKTVEVDEADRKRFS